LFVLVRGMQYARSRVSVLGQSFASGTVAFVSIANELSHPTISLALTRDCKDIVVLVLAPTIQSKRTYRDEFRMNRRKIARKKRRAIRHRRVGARSRLPQACVLRSRLRTLPLALHAGFADETCSVSSGYVRVGMRRPAGVYRTRSRESDFSGEV
jgi:hypothetical protein